MARIFTVVSGKGGVGKSTFCVNTALALCRNNKKVLLIDGDVALRSLDLLLGIDDMVLYDWSDVITHRCEADKARLFYNENLQLLPAPLEQPAEFNLENFKSLLSQYSDKYDYIFIDSPAGVGNLPLTYALSSDFCIVLATPDNVSARSAYIAGTQLSQAGISDKNIRLVINKFNPKAIKQGKLLNLDEVIDITYLRLIGVVPEDKKIPFTSVVENDVLSRLKAKNAFDNIAGRLMGKEIPLNL